MKTAILKYSTFNIGDDIQSIAVEQYLETINTAIDRDNLKESGLLKPHNLLMNGWFLSKPENWPPCKNINPIITSFHITHKKQCNEKLLSKNGVAYLRSKEPIGCRDLWTLDLLKRENIKSYFSGCVTLTLKKNLEDKKSGKIIFCDAFHGFPNGFKDAFVEKIPDRIRNNVEFVSHWNKDLGIDYIDRCEEANKLLESYKTASLVITSRLHCLLPCLAFNTPVYFVDYGYDTENDRNRFGGLLDFADVIKPDPSIKILRTRILKPFSGLEKNYLLNFMIKNINWDKSKNTKQDEVNKFATEIREQMIERIKNEFK